MTIKFLSFGNTYGEIIQFLKKKLQLNLNYSILLSSAVGILALLIFVPYRSQAQQKPALLSTGSVVYNDPVLERLIPRTEKIEIIGSGFQHIEGPVWVKDSNMLLFSDTKGQVIYRWSEENGLSKLLTNTGFTGKLPYSEEPGSNGLAVDQQGNLLICEHGDRRIAAYPLNRKYGLRTVSDNINSKRFNSPNDVVVKSDGSIWFTDPCYGLPQKENDSTREINIASVYQMSRNGKTKAIISDMPAPNGLAFSANQDVLYVSNSEMNHSYINVYPVNANGTVGKGKLFFDGRGLLKMQENEVIDGLKTDKEGNVWATGPGGLSVFTQAGKLLGTIKTGEVMSNCTWGNDGSTLYITAGYFLYRLKTNAKGNF